MNGDIVGTPKRRRHNIRDPIVLEAKENGFVYLVKLAFFFSFIIILVTLFLYRYDSNTNFYILPFVFILFICTYYF